MTSSVFANIKHKLNKAKFYAIVISIYIFDITSIAIAIFRKADDVITAGKLFCSGQWTACKEI